MPSIGQFSEKFLRDPFKAAAGGVVMAFASWNIYCHFCIYADTDFAFLKTYSIVPLVMFLGLCALAVAPQPVAICVIVLALTLPLLQGPGKSPSRKSAA